MKNLFARLCVMAAVIFLPCAPGAQELIDHDLKVVIYPEEQRFVAQDTIRVPEGLLKDLRFLLHSGLHPRSPTEGVRILRKSRVSGDIPLDSFKVIVPEGLRSFVITFGGKVYHPIEPYGKERARGMKNTPGTITVEGVYLSGATYWYPAIGEGLITFRLHIELPRGWDAVSQGRRERHSRGKQSTIVRWISSEPQEGIYLVAAPFHEYSRSSGRIEAMVFLRSPEEELAHKYLDATFRYLSMYEDLIGPYAYNKFALVENFWETGFGMPSFTLLGPRVIRFPFILHSSYPHEILHNWWGNGVYPDYKMGNWSEGLTAYLADHLIKEQKGNGAEYRLATLQKYADYVLKGRDFPLTEFRSRHSSPSEAVGYGKSLMFFHMLRGELGDDTFADGLRSFYKKNRFRFASFSDLRMSLEEVSGRRLSTKFDQWLERTGAPEIRVGNVRMQAEGNSFILTGRLDQVQPGRAYHLRIPVAVTMEGQGEVYQGLVTMDEKEVEMKFNLPYRPLRLDVDPEFDLFRRLDREEIPPALSQAFGSGKMLILLPSSADAELLEAYRQLSQSLRNAGPDSVEVKLDGEVKKLPSDRAVTIMGWESLFIDDFSDSLKGYDVAIGENGVEIGRVEVRRENHSIVLTARHPLNGKESFIWIATDLPEAIPGLGRKLPHYHKYSYLGFEGDEPLNVVKGRWPVLNSPMTVFIAQNDGSVPKEEMAKLKSRNPLIKAESVFSKETMMGIVRHLSSEGLGGRGFGSEGLDLAAQFIAGKFREIGLVPAGDAGTGQEYFLSWKARGGEPERTAVMRNVVGVIPGDNAALSSKCVLVGAHYDHLGTGWPEVREKKYAGMIHPGADDNASGIAVLIELARVLSRGDRPDRSIVFVAFSGEESGNIGSDYFVKNYKRYPPGDCIGMVNLDTVGRLGRGKLLLLGAESAQEWVHIFRGAGYLTGVEVELVSEPLDSSDQVIFHGAGVPAVQLFSGPHPDYHRPSDTVDRIDPNGLMKVASVAREVIEYLAGREEPLTVKINSSGNKGLDLKKVRKVSLGTIPDFAYSGVGYRVSGVLPGSPAEE
jgi:hypothetical protein